MNKDIIIFIDYSCPKPYDPLILETQGLGGTEATVIRIAEALSNKFDVKVLQHNREQGYQGKALYTSFEWQGNPRHVICLRDPRVMLGAKELYPKADISLWSHDFAPFELAKIYSNKVFEQADCKYNICVSNWHKTQCIEALRPLGYHGEFRHKVIHNPLAEDLPKPKREYDKNKLIWISSPHKGLGRALELMPLLSKYNPNFKLYIANPGYFETQLPNESWLVNIGIMKHKELMEFCSDALCLFYPNTTYPETFGLVFSECNTMGVPVLTHSLGAAPEVLDRHPDQLIDCTNTEEVIKRVIKWYNGARPIVRGKPEFKINNIINEWLKLL